MTWRSLYTFSDPSLVAQALTHPSRRTEHPDAVDYQRLEFLGDAVVQLVVSEMLLEGHPDWDEGRLSKARQSLVDRGTLGAVADRIGLSDALLAERGFVLTPESKVRSDLFEAFVGAIYEDGGLPAARAVVAPLLGPAIEALGAAPRRDPKSALQEWAEARGLGRPFYELADVSGPAHDRTHAVRVLVAGRTFGPAEGRKLKDAQARAAELALSAIAAGELEG